VQRPSFTIASSMGPGSPRRSACGCALPKDKGAWTEASSAHALVRSFGMETASASRSCAAGVHSPGRGVQSVGGSHDCACRSHTDTMSPSSCRRHSTSTATAIQRSLPLGLERLAQHTPAGHRRIPAECKSESACGPATQPRIGFPHSTARWNHAPDGLPSGAVASDPFRFMRGNHTFPSHFSTPPSPRNVIGQPYAANNSGCYFWCFFKWQFLCMGSLVFTKNPWQFFICLAGYYECLWNCFLRGLPDFKYCQVIVTASNCVQPRFAVNTIWCMPCPNQEEPNAQCPQGKQEKAQVWDLPLGQVPKAPTDPKCELTVLYQTAKCGKCDSGGITPYRPN